MNAMNQTVLTRPDTGAAEARAAIVQTLPLYEMMRMRAATTARRHRTLGFAADDPGSRMRWVNQVTHTHRRLSPESPINQRKGRPARQGGQI